MRLRVPSSVVRLCRDQLPLMCRAASGRRLLADAEAIQATDRWNSFDRFHDTTRTLERRYAEAGVESRVDPIQTGGRLGSGRWVIGEAADVRAAAVEVVEPVPARQRLLDYRDNPWHVVQWSSATPRGGLRAGLVILDEPNRLDGLPPGALSGKAVLTRLDARRLMPVLADKGAVAVIAQSDVPAHPRAVAWTKFGWGAVPASHAAARLVGFAVSRDQGEALRALSAAHGALTLRLEADVRRYVGTHDVVSGLIRGSQWPEEEVWAIAHSGEPGAVDNASGVATCLEIARVLAQLIGNGALVRPRRTIRLLCAYECYGFFAYLERVHRGPAPLAGVCLDSVGARPQVCRGRLEWHASLPMSAGFAERVGASILRAAVRHLQPGYRVCPERFVSTSDTLIGDPQFGFPCPWLTTHSQGGGRGFDAYHSSADLSDLLSPAGLATCAASMAAYLYFLAFMDDAQAAQLAAWETQRTVMQAREAPLGTDEAAYAAAAHAESMRRLRRWMAGPRQGELAARTDAWSAQVCRVCGPAVRPAARRRPPAGGGLVPTRTAPLSPTAENLPGPAAARIARAGVPPWALFWADGRRTIAQIAAMVACESSPRVNASPAPPREAVDVERLADFFAAHAELGYCEPLAAAASALPSAAPPSARR